MEDTRLASVADLEGAGKTEGEKVAETFIDVWNQYHERLADGKEVLELITKMFQLLFNATPKVRLDIIKSVIRNDSEIIGFNSCIGNYEELRNLFIKNRARLVEILSTKANISPDVSWLVSEFATGIPPSKIEITDSKGNNIDFDTVLNAMLPPFAGLFPAISESSAPPKPSEEWSLVRAARRGDIEKVKEISKIMSPESRDAVIIQEAAEMALEWLNFDIFKTLVDAGASPYITIGVNPYIALIQKLKSTFVLKRYSYYQTALTLAIKNDRDDIVRYLLAKPGIDIEQLCERGEGSRDALGLAVTLGKIDIVRLLYEALVMSAAKAGNTKSLKKLLEMPIELFEKEGFVHQVGPTALQLAAEFGRYEAFGVLLDKFGLADNSRQIFQWIIEGEHSNMARIVLENTKIVEALQKMDKGPEKLKDMARIVLENAKIVKALQETKEGQAELKKLRELAGISAVPASAASAPVYRGPR